MRESGKRLVPLERTPSGEQVEVAENPGSVDDPHRWWERWEGHRLA